MDGRARYRWRPAAAASAVLLAVPLAVGSQAAAESPARPAHAASGAHWVNGWQGSPTGASTFDPGSCPAVEGLADQTVRNVVTTSAEGDQVRVRVSNAFGAAPLQVGSAAVALAGKGAATVPGTTHRLTFSGHPGVLVAQGGDALSDPVPLHVEELQRLDVSVHLPGRTGPVTQHADSRETNYLAAGDQAADPAATDFDRPITCWLFASGVDVQAHARVVGTVVALGDSITDGYLSTVGADQRYPDHLARRLAALHGRTLAVSNAGISGNELLTDRVPEQFGVSAARRLPRDVLTQAGARSVILLEGINDIGAESARASDLIQVQEQIIAQAHAAGLRVHGGTLVPFGGSNGQYGGDYGTPAGEAQRQALNTWIRTSGAFDGVVDFDAALRDPQHPDLLQARYDSGDHLHPSDAGYRAMADAVDLGQLLAGAPRR